MKVLVSAMACNPVTGSEAHFGWSGVRALSREHQVHVLLFDFNRPYITQEDRHSLPNVKWHFLGKFRKHHPNRIVARLHAWLDTQTFQSQLILPYARALHHKERFDRIHHLTISSWRIPSPLWKLGIPLVWGPVGGGELIPPRFLQTLSQRARWGEHLRRFHTWIARKTPSVRNCVRQAACVLAANSETKLLLQPLRKNATVGLVSSAFFSDKSIARWQSLLGNKSTSGPLEIFAGGSLEGRKGISMALHALAKAKASGLNFRFRICGGGPEAGHLEKLSTQLGLTSREVEFHEFLPTDAYEIALRECHVFLQPSLRENAGLTLMEAMLAGVVPVVARLGGPGMIVTSEVGFPLEASSPEEMIAQIRPILLALSADRGRCQHLGEKASRHIADHYSEQAYIAKVEKEISSQSASPGLCIPR